MIIKTFRLRLTFLYTLVVVVMFSAFSFLVYDRFKHELLDSLDSYLLMEASHEANFAVINEQGNINKEIIKRFGDEYFDVINDKGKILITSMQARGPDRPIKTDLMADAFRGKIRFDTVKNKGIKTRFLYFPVNKESILRIWHSLEDAEASITNLKNLLKYYLPFVFMLSVIVSWVLAGQAIAPVIRIKSLADEVTRGKLNSRIEIRHKGVEIDDLVNICNEMLDSVQNSIETQKHFSSDVSHEIRSPLTSLRGSIEVALRKTRTPEEYEELLKNNLSDIIRLSKITDNLLFLAKADNNILEFRKQHLKINHLLGNVVERTRYKADFEGVNISENYYDDLELTGDIDLLDQAFSNLIDNAFKYTPFGGKITVETELEDGVIAVHIKDSGIGISQEDIPHIFERFYRGSKERGGRLGGTGLGLAITQWIINAHNGTIEVKSDIGSGSDFIVKFQKDENL